MSDMSHRKVSDEPWGYKLTFSIYFAGPPTEDALDKVIDAVNAAAPDAVFAGAALEDVPDEPKDQGGS
jgi:hypothetical protein